MEQRQGGLCVGGGDIEFDEADERARFEPFGQFGHGRAGIGHVKQEEPAGYRIDIGRDFRFFECAGNKGDVEPLGLGPRPGNRESGLTDDGAVRPHNVGRDQGNVANPASDIEHAHALFQPRPQKDVAGQVGKQGRLAFQPHQFAFGMAQYVGLILCLGLGGGHGRPLEMIAGRNFGNVAGRARVRC